MLVSCVYAAVLNFLTTFATSLEHVNEIDELGGYSLILDAVESNLSSAAIFYGGIIVLSRASTFGKAIPEMQARPAFVKMLKTTLTSHRASPDAMHEEVYRTLLPALLRALQ